jgi:hypothetical protein
MHKDRTKVELKSQDLNGSVISKTKLFSIRIRNFVSSLRPNRLKGGTAQIAPSDITSVPSEMQRSASGSLPIYNAPEPTTVTGKSAEAQWVRPGGDLTRSAFDTSPTAMTQPPFTPLNIRNDFMLLCSDDKGWLTSRDDLNASQIRSDSELFNAFRLRLYQRKNWVHWSLSLKSIQRISFVKVGRLLISLLIKTG